MNQTNCTYLIIEDHKMLASLIEKQILTVEGVGIVLSAKSANEAIKCFKQNYIDFVLLDLILPDMDGMTLIPKFKEINSNVKIIVLSAETNVSIIRKVMKLGINAFVSKMNNEEDLFNAINSVKLGKRFVSDNILELLLNEEEKIEIREIVYENKILTNRELEVLSYIANELTSNQIADLLCISRHTVETHKRRMMQKLKVTNTAGLIKIAFEKGFLDN